MWCALSSSGAGAPLLEVVVAGPDSCVGGPAGAGADNRGRRNRSSAPMARCCALPLRCSSPQTSRSGSAAHRARSSARARRSCARLAKRLVGAAAGGSSQSISAARRRAAPRCRHRMPKSGGGTDEPDKSGADADAESAVAIFPATGLPPTRAAGAPPRAAGAPSPRPGPGGEPRCCAVAKPGTTRAGQEFFAVCALVNGIGLGHGPQLYCCCWGPSPDGAAAPVELEADAEPEDAERTTRTAKLVCKKRTRATRESGR